jgi:ABC-2 type transport system ATP-binding protein
VSSEILKINNLSKFYGQVKGIENVSLTVNKGEIFGFIGPNGAGKSTTIRTVLGLLQPTSGSVTIFGQDALKNGAEIRKKIGYLPSEVFYYENMKAKDLLTYSASFYDLKKSEVEPRLEKLASLMQLDLNKKIEDMSYGNKKKVGVVQGLLHEPELIILDEPTGGLDPLMQKQFYELLRQENTRGATILFSSHNLSEVQKMCHRVAIIRNGHIIKIDKVDSLISGSYKRVKLELESAGDVKKISKDKNVADFKQEDSININFLWNGSANELVSLLERTKIVNLLVEEPDLEEIFLHYYKNED